MWVSDIIRSCYCMEYYCNLTCVRYMDYDIGQLTTYNKRYCESTSFVKLSLSNCRIPMN